MVRICLHCGRPGFNPWVGRSPGGGHGNPLQCSCLGNPHGQRSLVGYSPWGHRVRHNWVTKRSTAQGNSEVFREEKKLEGSLQGKGVLPVSNVQQRRNKVIIKQHSSQYGVNAIGWRNPRDKPGDTDLALLLKGLTDYTKACLLIHFHSSLAFVEYVS